MTIGDKCFQLLNGGIFIQGLMNDKLNRWVVSCNNKANYVLDSMGHLTARAVHSCSDSEAFIDFARQLLCCVVLHN